MKKKLLSIFTAIIMVIALIPTVAFAIEEEEPTVQNEPEIVLEDTEDVANSMGNYIDESEINDSINKEGGEYVVDDTDVDISIPVDGSDTIVMETEEESIAMGLPEEVNSEEGILSDNGTVIYNPDNEDMAVGVQALSEGTGDDQWSALRVLVEITSADANKEYGFNYRLPDSYKLISAEEWYDTFIEPYVKDKVCESDYYTPGEVYVVNTAGSVVETIEPAWAYDANNNTVHTRYEIRGSKLVQVVDFNENSAFPIIADPTKHPDKYTTLKLSEKGVKKVCNKLTKSSPLADTIVVTAGGAVSVGGYCASKFLSKKALTKILGPAGVVWDVIIVSNQIYDYNEYRGWKKIYNKLHNNKKYNYVTLKYKWKWHGGKKTYYPSGKPKVTFSKK